MKAAVMRATNAPLEIEEVTIDDPGPGEVLLATAASGICHSDLHVIEGGLPMPPPCILGHEPSGIVEAIGDGVTDFVPGDHVIGCITNWCGVCKFCTGGRPYLCPSQFNGRPEGAKSRLTGQDGNAILQFANLSSFAEKMLCPERSLVKIRDDMPLDRAALIGCGVTTGVGAALNTARVEAGSTCVVIGCGGVGLSIIQGCRIAGADRIIAVDVNPERLQLAKRFGATHTILADRDDEGLLAAAAQVKALTQGRGADCAIECTAVPALGAAPLAMIRNAGIAVQASGIEQELTIDMNLFEWDKVYINPLYGQCRPRIDLPKLLQLYASGDLLLDELVTRTYPLTELATAFDDMLAGRNAKGVIVFDEAAD